MFLLSLIYRNGIWISVPVFILSAAALVYLIKDVIKVMREAHLISVPLVEEQEVEFTEPGRVVLCVEGPLFTTQFARLSYRLIGSDGRPVESRRSWFRSRSSGLSKVRMELEYYRITSPGSHGLQIQGLRPGEEPGADNRIVFMRPHLARSLVRVVGIVLASVLLIGSLVLFFMRLFAAEGAS
jgi:hypothetical protein